MEQTNNTRIKAFKPLASPRDIREKFAVGSSLTKEIEGHRSTIARILKGEDPRLMVVVGPCSIHNLASGYAYAEKLAALQEQVKEKFFIIMRVYFEKPRTTVGWKGLINDPHLDGSRDVESGLLKARSFLHQVASLGLPTATEFLDPIVPQYISDLVSWAAIGARTTESQTHREMASGLSMPVGFKNATDGGLQVAIDALVSSSHGHSFLGITGDGQTAVVETTGNEHGHIILRGGGGVPNYSPSDIAAAKTKLRGVGSARPIMVDCSHGNSNKDYTKQPEVFKDVVGQHSAGETAINGLMLESNLVAGKQPLTKPEELTYGQSITDGCISWETTEELLLEASRKA